MKRFGFLLGILFATVTAYAGFEAYNGTTSLNIFDKIQCSTGLTCTRSNGKLLMVSSPTVSGAAITITGAEATDAILNLKADESDDSGDDFAIKATTSDTLIFQSDVSGSLVTKWTMSTAGAVTMVGGLAGDGGDNLVGFLSPLVAATATTITAAQCGSTFYNAGAIEIELPEASTVPGCTLTFVVLNASNFTIDPDAADIIVLLTNAAGDSLIADAVGETLVIRAVSASQWVVVGTEKGTWTDSN